MKRQQDRDTPPRGKRSRMLYPPHDEGGRDRMSPDLDRREGRNSKLSSSRDSKNHRGRDPYDYDERMPKRARDDRSMHDGFGPNMSRSDRTLEYRTLCLTNLNPQVSDNAIKETLYQEFRKYGEFNVRITYSGEMRMAYINFRFPEDARDAKHSRPNFRLFDRQVRIDAVYNHTINEPPRTGRSISPDFSHNGGSRDRYNMNMNTRSVSPHSVGRGRTGRHSSIGRDMPPQRERDYHPVFENRGGGRQQQQQQHPPNQMQQHQAHQQGFQEQQHKQNDQQRQFPHHLQHIQPEDDDKATRTLFAGNLDVSITEAELRRIFERYGRIEDIDIKRPQKGAGNAYAFIQYENLDVAHKAKVELSGQYIGKFQCKIGYGKATPSNCLWVGGLGPWVRTEILEREFDRFGVINKIEWPHGKSFAYVLYDSIDAAQAAIQDMRGFSLGGPERRLRVDFADANQISAGSPSRPDDHRDDQFNTPNRFDRDRDNNNRNFSQGFNNRGGGPKFGNNYDRPQNNQRNDWAPPHDRDPLNAYRNPDNPQDFEMDRRKNRDDNDKIGGDLGIKRKQPRTPMEDQLNDRNARQRSKTPTDRSHDFTPLREREADRYSVLSDQSDMSKRRRQSLESNDNNSTFDREHKLSDSEDRSRTKHQSNGKELTVVDQVDNLMDLAKCLPVAWNGAMVLKNSAFPTRLHLVTGDIKVVESLMKDPSVDVPKLRITQRLRLDQSKLEEVGRRVSTAGSGGHCILLAMPAPVSPANDEPNSQQRPLRNLVTYLKQKEAAGVIALPLNPKVKDKDNVGVLHAFPPCQFGQDYLVQRASKLGSEPSKEDHLVIVVVRGAP